MADNIQPDSAFDVTTSRLLRREALRRAAEELNTTSGRGLEATLARVSAEVTAEAISRKSLGADKPPAPLPVTRNHR